MNSPFETPEEIRTDELVDLALEYRHTVLSDPRLLAEGVAEYLQCTDDTRWQTALFAAANGATTLKFRALLQEIAQWYGRRLAEEHLAGITKLLEAE